MKIVNKKKFIRTLCMLILLVAIFIFFAKNTYSKGEISYKEQYIYTGDTLWSIAKKEVLNNKYFENKDIRYVIFELQNINNLENSDLVEGTVIKIPIYE